MSNRPFRLESYGDKSGYLGTRHFGAKRPDVVTARALAATLADLHGEAVEVRCVRGPEDASLLLWATRHVPGVTTV